MCRAETDGKENGEDSSLKHKAIYMSDKTEETHDKKVTRNWNFTKHKILSCNLYNSISS